MLSFGPKQVHDAVRRIQNLIVRNARNASGFSPTPATLRSAPVACNRSGPRVERRPSPTSTLFHCITDRFQPDPSRHRPPFVYSLSSPDSTLRPRLSQCKQKSGLACVHAVEMLGRLWRYEENSCSAFPGQQFIHLCMGRRAFHRPIRP
jgi:hypothetical protein